jgi:hypothetical protein
MNVHKTYMLIGIDCHHLTLCIMAVVPVILIVLHSVCPGPLLQGTPENSGATVGGGFNCRFFCG